MNYPASAALSAADASSSPTPDTSSTAFHSSLKKGQRIMMDIGNPGTGKSFLLNSLIGEAIFLSGGSAGTGIPVLLPFHKKGDQVFVDTFGLADSEQRHAAAKQISDSLRLDGVYQIFFVVRLNTGRVPDQDVVTMCLVMKACEEVPGFCYSVIFNRCDSYDMKRVPTDKAYKEEIEAKLLAKVPIVTTCFYYLPETEKYLGDNVVGELPDDFKEFVKQAPCVHIGSDLVQDVRGDLFQDMEANIEALQRQKKEYETLISQVLGRQKELEEQLKKRTGSFYLDRAPEHETIVGIESTCYSGAHFLHASDHKTNHAAVFAKKNSDRDRRAQWKVHKKDGYYCFENVDLKGHFLEAENYKKDQTRICCNKTYPFDNDRCRFSIEKKEDDTFLVSLRKWDGSHHLRVLNHETDLAEVFGQKVDKKKDDKILMKFLCHKLPSNQDQDSIKTIRVYFEPWCDMGTECEYEYRGKVKVGYSSSTLTQESQKEFATKASFRISEDFLSGGASASGQFSSFFSSFQSSISQEREEEVKITLPCKDGQQKSLCRPVAQIMTMSGQSMEIRGNLWKILEGPIPESFELMPREPS